ncbi:MAG: iron-containing alcohol dehydrogenase [Rhodospirillaceae bacterium]|nr:iron-containing alcohol dehydrogenase [Rhodospirillaceae bacterium]
MTIAGPITSSINGTWSYPTQIRFGPGRVAEVVEACRELGMARPLLVTDSGLADAGFVRDALAANDAAGLPTALFSDVQGNPTGENVTEGVRVFRDGGHDGVIALGGGSGIDAAKAIAMVSGQKLSGQTGTLWDYLDRSLIDPAGMAPVVALPTTAGTGSEVGRASIITETGARAKRIVAHPNMMPGIVIADPELSVGLPPDLTAATGIDALIHCLEAYCAPGFHPQAEGIALEGMRLIHDWLPRAYADGRDIAARAHMLAAASMGAIAFQKGLGGVHSISHAVGARYNTHHGLTNAIVAPYVLRFNRPAIEDKMVHLARVLDLQGGGFDAVMAWLLALRRDLNIPHNLGAIGVPDDEAEALAALAAADPTASGNPVPIDAAALRPIFLDCVHGDL